ncbi:DNA sulfur modification protein DndD [Ruminococcus flavefaciens]|uniref:Nuclease SbcCD subunit C n=1 Tax=Ruminococcus flavefaciens TaxID=1265 RepID=A0A315XWG3_RUMFL|nr:DNA sulfur modification protein DndD [Ruminococcus flavefaciens]PWJ10976.1 DNA sulfur modification protein DndD [Ruminococcus flavefaciens]SSA51050.1 DNA sulfur modification protein DndD [Ruminococcus flavefaciens]
MIINKLQLHNFGVYASDNTFVFNSEKPVVLIGGMNGRGKTTFLEAILLALYGKNSFAVQESIHGAYGKYLKAHTNIADGTNESFVELEFSIEEDGKNNIYTVNRSWNTNVKNIKDKVTVKKNGNDDSFLAQNWTMFVESILPSALANFYFFDGEKIAELAESDTSIQMKSSIKALLGINVIDLLENDITRIIKKMDTEQTDSYNGSYIEELRRIKDEKADILKQIDDDIVELEKKLSRTNKKIDKKTEEFNAKGGQIASQSQELFSERIKLNSEINKIQETYLELAAGELPLLMVEDLLSSIKDKSETERENKSMSVAVRKINQMFKEYSYKTQQSSDEISQFIKYLKKQAKKKQTKSVFDLSENGYIQLSVLLSNQLENTQNSYNSSKVNEQKIMKRINEIDNYLSVDIDEKAIARLYKRIGELQNERMDIEIQIEAKKKQRITANGECQKATTEFNRCVDKAIASMERGDDVQRIHRYALKAQQLAARYKIELQRSKISNLADTMTKCYKKILGKKNLIDRIEMDAETLDYHYIDVNGNEVMKSGLSAGEKQLMVIAMLWALAECSNKMLPVIIDTPLARLDSLHRKALIERYFPNASSQTVILSTDSEIDSNYYNIIKPFVSNEFTLVYDENEKRSYVRTGYFEEEQA